MAVERRSVLSEGGEYAGIWAIAHTIGDRAVWRERGVYVPAVVEPSPTAVLQPRRDVPVASGAWLAGYRAFGGPAAYEQHFIEDVIPCESDWRIDPGNPAYRGLMQWHPDSWARASSFTGLTDWRDPYAQGAATAEWVKRISSPGGSGGWPVCWWRGTVP